MSTSLVTNGITVSGIGLITGLPITATITENASVTGSEPYPNITFHVQGVSIPASAAYAVNTDRGVTLGMPSPNGLVTLSIVEHFLSACAMVGLTNLDVTLDGGPELPLLDGSSIQWVEALQPLIKATPVEPAITLREPLTYTDPQDPLTSITAIPANELIVTYMMDFPHPSVQQRYWTWSQSTQGDLLTSVAPARTWGFLNELPILQERGLAKGVSLENTLGLTDEGGYTSNLRMSDEPLRHKVLDFIGDMALCGVPITRLNAHVLVMRGGHTSHVAFGKLLAQH